MRRRGIIIAEAFSGLAEIAGYQIPEILRVDRRCVFEEIDVVHGHEPRCHIPLVLARDCRIALQVCRHLVIGAEELVVTFGVFITNACV